MGSGKVAVHCPSTTLRAVPLPELKLREEANPPAPVHCAPRAPLGGMIVPAFPEPSPQAH